MTRKILYTDGGLYFLTKRIMDLSVILLSSALWLPSLLIIGLAIKISDPRSNIFFLEDRTGWRGRQFRIVKFRTMIPNAHLLREEINHLNERHGPHFKTRHDPRVTRIGKWLRRFHLDELPQVFNILLGDMSLVGPRPTSIASVDHLIWQTERFEALPGLTCYWQIQEDQYPDFADRSRLDILYCRKKSLRTDIEIILRTVRHVARGAGY